MLPHSSVGRESACNAGDLGSIPGWEDPLEKEMATHSSILAWRVPWTEEPGRLQSMRFQKSWTRLKRLSSSSSRRYPVSSGGSDGKESACNAGDLGSMPGLGRSPGEGSGYLLPYSCLESPMDRGA